jgi:aromatase
VNEVQHAVTVAAPPETVYGLLARAEMWPVNFHPTVHVEQLEQGAGTERIRIWALAGDQVKVWTSRRELDPAGLRITFRQEVSQPPIAAMSGRWILRGLPDGGTEIVLEHGYRAVDDGPEDLAWIAEVTDRNSRVELANLKSLAEQAADRADLELTFEDSVTVSGEVSEVYDFLYQAHLWPKRLPHVSRMDLREDTKGIQVMEMETTTNEGATHTTKSVRVCVPDQRIVYKQVVVPPLMTAHTGEWRVTPVRGGAAVTSRHSVVIRPEAVTGILGEGATVADAREFARRALSGNSRITMEHAKAFAEGRRAHARI